MPAGIAAVEIRVLREAARMIAHDKLGGLGHHVNRAVRPVHNFLGMPIAEHKIAAGMTSVRAGRGIAAAILCSAMGIPRNCGLGVSRGFT